MRVNTTSVGLISIKSQETLSQNFFAWVECQWNVSAATANSHWTSFRGGGQPERREITWLQENYKLSTEPYYSTTGTNRVTEVKQKQLSLKLVSVKYLLLTIFILCQMVVEYR